jgi:hypothetical protein
MDPVRTDLNRRDFLKRLLAAGIVGSAGTSVIIRQVLAMGEGGQLPEGVRKVQGTVMVNGNPAQVGALVFPGDIITTGKASFGVFVIGKDAFLVRENSRIELAGDRDEQGKGATKIVRTIKVATGKILSVFGPGGKRIETVTAVAGLRGTGVYVEAEPDLTYLCLCYGATDLRSTTKPDEQQSFSAIYHEPRYILPACQGKGKIFIRAPKINHEDAELEMLEALVGRETPSTFSKRSSSGSGLFY